MSAEKAEFYGAKIKSIKTIDGLRNILLEIGANSDITGDEGMTLGMMWLQAISRLESEPEETWFQKLSKLTTRKEIIQLLTQACNAEVEGKFELEEYMRFEEEAYLKIKQIDKPVPTRMEQLLKLNTRFQIDNFMDKMGKDNSCLSDEYLRLLQKASKMKWEIEEKYYKEMGINEWKEFCAKHEVPKEFEEGFPEDKRAQLMEDTGDRDLLVMKVSEEELGYIKNQTHLNNVMMGIEPLNETGGGDNNTQNKNTVRREVIRKDKNRTDKTTFPPHPGWHVNNQHYNGKIVANLISAIKKLPNLTFYQILENIGFETDEDDDYGTPSGDLFNAVVWNVKQRSKQ